MPKYDLKRSFAKLLAKSKEKQSQKEIQGNVDLIYEQYIKSYYTKLSAMDQSYKEIPAFFNADLNSNAEELTIPQQVQWTTKQIFLNNKSDEILDQEDIQRLIEEIQQNQSYPEDGTQRINYDNFLKIKQALGEKFTHFFQATEFLKFDWDEFGRIDASHFVNTIIQKNHLQETRIQMSLYDSQGYGFLTWNEVLQFLQDVVQQGPDYNRYNMQSQEELFQIGLQKIFFFLDPFETEKIFIKNFIFSQIFQEISDYKNKGKESNNEQQTPNWFSFENLQRLKETFKKINQNSSQTEFISQKELKTFYPDLSQKFLQRAFEILQDNSQGLSFVKLVEFILLIENRKEIRSIKFHFECLDLLGSGELDSKVIYLFFWEIQERCNQTTTDKDKLVRTEDIIDEIFDMALVRNKKTISLGDLLQSQKADLIFGILTDQKCFNEFDLRENQIQAAHGEDTFIEPKIDSISNSSEEILKELNN